MRRKNWFDRQLHNLDSLLWNAVVDGLMRGMRAHYCAVSKRKNEPGMEVKVEKRKINIVS